MIKLREQVIYESFKTRKELIERILDMINTTGLNDVLYKGHPLKINYKILKRSLLGKMDIKIEPDEVRKMYYNIIEPEQNRKFCIIYKEIKTKRRK